MSKNKPEVDCTKWCRSRKHGQIITSAITKRSISDKELASFIKGTCSNFIKAFDYEGRTALHMAVSRGRVDLMKWLVHHSSEAFANARDRESGYTPLHRSIFYGQINVAVALTSMGANADITDKDDYTALDHALLDRNFMYKHDPTQPCDSYVWGTNTNYTLGTGSNRPRTWAEVLSTFSRANANVKQVCLGKFHSAWVVDGSSAGEVWACGQLSRAGGPHATALRPTPLRLPEPCRALALTTTSTVMLLESGLVLQYSLNSADNVSQSSTKTPSCIKLPSIKPLLKLASAIGICTGKSHGVVWNKNAVYTWGTNVGQLGHPEAEKEIVTPKRVLIPMNNKEGVTLELAAAGDAASVLATSRGDVYLLHNYICKKIAIKQINLRQVCVHARVSAQGALSRVTVLLLTNVGQLMIWEDNTNRVTRCVFGLAHQVLVTHAALFQDTMYLTSTHGEAYTGHITRRPPAAPAPAKKERERDERSTLVKFLEKDDCTSVRITKIPYIHRAVAIAVDGEGLNFACLQTKSTCGLKSLPTLSPSCMTKHMDTLRETANQHDLLHDVVFQVAHRSFPAHMFIIASSSEHLYKLYQEHLTTPGEKPTISLDNVHPEAFERVLKYMYTGSCDVAEVGPCPLKIRKEDLVGKKEKEDLEMEDIKNPSEISAFQAYKKNKRSRISPETRRVHTYVDPVKLVQATAKRLQVMQLHKLLDNFFYRDGVVILKDSADASKNPPPRWSRDAYDACAALADTTVCCKDGERIAAHKCVLAARLEYFNGMFMHSWTESKMLSKVTLPYTHGILLPAINFLYTDTCPELEENESIDFICKLMVVADQLFISRLKEMCEVALANLLSLKYYPELCQFAHFYNAPQLKQCCMEFISLNLTTVLETRGLDNLEPKLIDDLTEFYCKYNPIMSSRIITPFYNAIDDGTIEEFAKQYPVDLNVIDEDVRKDHSLLDTSIKKKNKQSKKIEYTVSEKERMRYESVSSVTSLDLSNETGDITLSLSKVKEEKGTKEKQEKWIEVPTSQKQQKVVQARLKAIVTARDILNETPVESFTKLVKNSSAINIANPRENASTSRLSMSPKDSPIDAQILRSPQGNMTISLVGPKLSQKQRKKLALQGEQSPVNPPQNLNDYFSKLSVSPEKPKNPWKIVEQPIASSPKAKALEFNQILTDQRKQKEDFSRIMTKPLAMTQLEDKAIEQLERFYNAHEIGDELITVRRIELQVSSPQWLHTAPK